MMTDLLSRAEDAPLVAQEPFAQYLAKRFIADKGYIDASEPELAALKDICSRVLTRSDGLSFSIVCIVDAESDPKRQFAPSVETVRQIGAACREKYSGRLNGRRLPATIKIIEIRSHVTQEDIQRLKAYRGRWHGI